MANEFNGVDLATVRITNGGKYTLVIQGYRGGANSAVTTVPGDLQQWTQFERTAPRSKPFLSDAPGPLTQAEVMEVMVGHADELSTCTALGRKDGAGAVDLFLRWNVSAEGKPHDLASRPPELAEDPVTKCLLEALATFRFPGRPQATREIDFPIRFNR